MNYIQIRDYHPKKIFEYRKEKIMSTKKSDVDTCELFAYYMSQKKSTDCGAVGKSAEEAVKPFINRNSLLNGRVTPNDGRKYDIYFMVNKKRINIEIKTVCGELAEVKSLSDDVNELASLIYPQAHYIAYAPEIDPEIPMEKQFFVFEREQFIEMCVSYAGTGSALRTKKATVSGSTKLSFQSFYSETRKRSSKKLANHIWNCCFDCPTIEEFMQVIKG